MKSIALLSGGLDSTVLTTSLCQIYEPQNVMAVSIRYGQRHTVEVKHAIQIARYLKCDFQVMDLPDFILNRSDSQSVLTQPDLEMPHLTYKELQQQVGPSSTYVPFRNGLFVSIATAVALQTGAEEVAIASHAEDARNWAYPDCTPEFNGAMAAAVYIGTYNKTRLVTPFQWMMKHDIVRLGLQIGAPFHLTWSCYEGRSKACGVCPTCIERIHAFEVNGVQDPIEYEERRAPEEVG